jgi:hypothetical protein
MVSNATGFTYSVNAPYTGPIARFSAGGSYDMQLNASYSGGGTLIAYRTRNGDVGSWNAWYQFITTANIGGQSVNYATTAGSATSATLAANTSSISSATGGSYNWTGIQYFVSNRNTTSDSPPLQAYSNNGSGAIMSFHRGGYYAVNMGLDSDNVFRIGGWSASPNRLVLDMSGNLTVAGALAGSNLSGTNTGDQTNISGQAGYLGAAGYIYRGGFSGNWNADFQNTPAGSYRYYGDNAGDANGPGGTWWFSESFRHSNGSNYWGTQVAWGWEDNANRLATRNITGNSFGGWVYYLNSSNFTSYIDAPNKAGTSYYQANTWIQFNGAYGLYVPSVNGAHFYPNTSSTYTTWSLAGSRNGYGGIHDTYSNVQGFMYDGAGNGGVYREANGRWYWYHLVANNCMGINTSTTSASYGLYVSGAIYSTDNICAYSDVRKKENIVTVENALEKVLKLRGVNYNRIDDETKTRKIGVIAQETELVLPEVVTYAADVDEYSVMYGNMSGLFIEAFKEQQVEIQQLKELVNQLLNK